MRFYPKINSYIDYLETLYNKITDIQEIAYDNLKRAKSRSKRYYDKKLNPHVFRIGDKAFLLKQPTHKLGDKYVRPHEITEILKNNNVKIGAKGTRMIHADKHKLCSINPEVRRVHQHRPLEDTTGSEATDADA